MFHIQSTNVLELDTRDKVEAKATEMQRLGMTLEDHDLLGLTVEERKLRVDREREAHDKQLGGLAKWYDWAIAVVPSLNASRRVNGQHTSRMFLDLTDEEWDFVHFPVIVIETIYNCDTMQDVAILYEQFDTAKAVRSREDLMTVHLANEEDLRGLVDSYAGNKGVQGLDWYQKAVEERVRPSTSSDLTIVHENHDVHTFLRFCGKEGLQLTRALSWMTDRPVLAAIYHTTRCGGAEDRDFWKRISGGVRSFSDSDEDSYEFKLSSFLGHTRDKSFDWPKRVRESFTTHKAPNALEIYGTCLRVFAAQKRGTRIGEAFLPIKEKKAKALTERLYPLPQVQAAD